MNLALNNLQWLICHKIKPNHTRRIKLRSKKQKGVMDMTLKCI